MLKILKEMQDGSSTQLRFAAGMCFCVTPRLTWLARTHEVSAGLAGGEDGLCVGRGLVSRAWREAAGEGRGNTGAKGQSVPHGFPGWP